MRILILNQYFPPDPAPTGILLRELGDHLASQGHEIGYIAAGQNYRGSKKGSRMVREARGLVSILLRGLFARRADLVISGTSPPCLLFVATLIAMRHRAKSVHWAMDLYPEIAVALGELRRGLAVRCIESLIGWAYRHTNVAIALDEDMAVQVKKYGVHTEVIAPWLTGALADSLDETDDSTPPVETFTWIYSGNLGRAHEWATLLEAQAILERRCSPSRLVFQGGGPSWSFAQERASELHLNHCEWKEYAPERDLRASLLACHALVATQKPEARGLLWPSKLALLSNLPRPIVWVGAADGAIARELRAQSHTGVFEPGQARELADWIEQLRVSENFTRSRTGGASEDRELALKKWTQILMRVMGEGEA